MAQPKFVRVDDAGKITAPGVVQQMTDIAKANGVPTGGTTGQVLQRSSTGAATWGNAPSGLPAGGSAGQVVTRQADGTAAWATVQGAPGRGITSVVASTTDPAKATVTYTDGATATLALPSGAAGKSITSFGDPDGEGVSVVTFSDGTTTTITLPIGNVTQNLAWSRDAQAKAQGYWIVVSPTAPESGTYTTADGTVVPVIWQKPIEVVVPVAPENPQWDQVKHTVSVPDLLGVGYRVTSLTQGGVAKTVSYTIPPGAPLDVLTVPGGYSTLPVAVKVEAFAKPGYTLPSSYSWQHDMVDPNQKTLIASDSFTATAAPWNTDNALGGSQVVQFRRLGSGTPPMFEPDGTVLKPAGAATENTWVGAQITGVKNLVVEFDLLACGANTGNQTNGGVFAIGLRVSNTQASSGGFQFSVGMSGAGGRVVTFGGKTVRTGAPADLVGRWVVEINGNTGAVTGPGVPRTTYDLSAITVGAGDEGLQFRHSTPADANTKIDNLKIYKIGA